MLYSCFLQYKKLVTQFSVHLLKRIQSKNVIIKILLFCFRPTPSYSLKVDEVNNDLKKGKKHSKKKNLEEKKYSNRPKKHKEKSSKERSTSKEGNLLSLADEDNVDEKETKRKKIKKDKKEKKKPKDKERKVLLLNQSNNKSVQ